MTRIILSISFEIMVASVTATSGGLSKRIISYSDSSNFTNFDIFLEPNISEGFGGINPEVIKDRLSISEFPVEEFLKAHEIRPSRFEAMYQIIKHFREKRFHHAAYTLCKKEITKPESKDILFIDKSINNYKLQDELAVCAYWVGEYQESLDLNKKLLENPNLPQHERERIQKNTEFAQNKIQE